MCEVTPAARITLEKSLESPATVRDFVERNVCPVHGGRGMAAVQLLASELVTNAVLYGAEPIWAEITCEVHTTRMEVHDELRDGEVLAGTDGMGLLLVNKVAHEWGTTRTLTGKTVWGIVPTGFLPVQRPRVWEGARGVGASRAARSARPTVEA